MNFQASRKKRHAAALRLPGTVTPPRIGGRRNLAAFFRFQRAVAAIDWQEGSQHRNPAADREMWTRLHRREFSLNLLYQ